MLHRSLLDCIDCTRCPLPHPLTAADLWFFYAQNAISSHLFLRSIRSWLILSIILIETWPKHAKMTFNQTFNTFSIPHSPVDKIHAPLRSNPWTATVLQVCYVSTWYITTYNQRNRLVIPVLNSLYASLDPFSLLHVLFRWYKNIKY